jgi:hypothetical protein
LPYALTVLWFVVFDWEWQTWVASIAATVVFIPLALLRSRTNSLGYLRLLWIVPFGLLMAFINFAYLMEAIFGPRWADI